MRSGGPWLSLVVAVGQGDEPLGPGLEAAAALAGEEVEVILVLARGVARPEPGALPAGVRVLVQPAGGLAAARDLAVTQARAGVIFFTRSGCLVPPDLPLVLAGHFSQPGVVAVGGALLPANPDQPLARLAACDLAFGLAGLAGVENPCPHLACAAFERRALIEAGLFDQSLPDAASCDALLGRRLVSAGGTLVFDPELKVRLTLPAGWGPLWREQLERGRQRYRELRRLGGAPAGLATPERFSPWQPLVLLLAGGLAGFLGPQDPARGLSLAAACLLLLYPLNRDFLKYVAGREPDILRQALAYCLLRPAAWTLGLLGAALNRVLGESPLDTGV